MMAPMLLDLVLAALALTMALSMRPICASLTIMVAASVRLDGWM